MPRGKRNTPFQQGHGLLYGLRPVARDPSTNAVTSVACRFCEKWGREEKVGAKRRATQRVKHFKQPFRTENYHQHHLGQHRLRWTEYKTLSAERKVSYLASPASPSPQDAYTHIENVVNNPSGPPAPPPPVPLPQNPSVARLPSLKKPPHARPLKFVIDRAIVDIIIGDVLFDPTTETLSKEHAISAFTAPHDAISDYTVNIKNTRLFDTCVQYISMGATPKLATLLIAEMAKTPTVAPLTVQYMHECTEAKVFAYVRCVIAHNLQGIADLLRATWAFSIALQRVEYLGTCYVDVSIRFCVTDDIHTFHLIAFPATERYNMDAMYKPIACTLEVLCATWRDKLIGVSTDGSELAHTAAHAIVERIRAETSASLMRTWAGAHQLDLVVRAVYRDVLDETFYDTLSNLIAYLRRQDSLIVEMKSTCPKVAAASWLSVERALKWIKTHRIRILQYLDKMKSGCGPSMSWWVLAMALYEFTHAVAKTYRRILGLTTLVARQAVDLSELLQTLHRISGCKGPITEDELSLLREWDLIVDNKYAVQKSVIRNFLSGLGTFVHISMSELSSASLSEVIDAVGTMFLSAVVGISRIIESRTDIVASAAGLPPVLPSELNKLTRAAFNNDVRSHAHRLSTTFSPAQIEQIEEEFGDFLEAYHREEIFKATMQPVAPQKDFGRAWGFLRDRFRQLYLYCGGVGSAYPGIFPPLPSFTIRPQENEVLRIAGMIDFPLEGSLHSMQYPRLSNILQEFRS